MDRELIEQIQEITEFKLYRLWRVGNSKSKGSWETTQLFKNINEDTSSLQST